MQALLLVTSGRVSVKAETDWPKLVQQPYEQLPASNAQLAPLLATASGSTIDTPAAWTQKRKDLEAAWRIRLGKPPKAQRNLDAKTHSLEEAADHIRKLVSFSAHEDQRMRAYLLVPKTRAKRLAAVVVFHETTPHTFREPVGLAGDPQQALALELVRRGFITLAPECYIMQGHGPVEQARVLAKSHPEWTGLGKLTFDAGRCVDYLTTLSEVDAARIGCIGHSLGAKEVLYAMAFQSCYRAGVFSEGGIGLRMSNWSDPWYLGPAIEQRPAGMDHHQLLAMIAPRPILIVAGDSADTNQSWSYVHAARGAFGIFGARNRIGFYNHKLGHSFPRDARELSYRWLEEWLAAK